MVGPLRAQGVERDTPYTTRTNRRRGSPPVQGSESGSSGTVVPPPAKAIPPPPPPAWTPQPASPPPPVPAPTQTSQDNEASAAEDKVKFKQGTFLGMLQDQAGQDKSKKIEGGKLNQLVMNEKSSKELKETLELVDNVVYVTTDPDSGWINWSQVAYEAFGEISVINQFLLDSAVIVSDPSFLGVIGLMAQIITRMWTWSQKATKLYNAIDENQQALVANNIAKRYAGTFRNAYGDAFVLYLETVGLDFDANRYMEDDNLYFTPNQVTGDHVNVFVKVVSVSNESYIPKMLMGKTYKISLKNSYPLVRAFVEMQKFNLPTILTGTNSVNMVELYGDMVPKDKKALGDKNWQFTSQIRFQFKAGFNPQKATTVYSVDILNDTWGSMEYRARYPNLTKNGAVFKELQNMVANKVADIIQDTALKSDSKAEQLAGLGTKKTVQMMFASSLAFGMESRSTDLHTRKANPVKGGGGGDNMLMILGAALLAGAVVVYN